MMPHGGYNKQRPSGRSSPSLSLHQKGKGAGGRAITKNPNPNPKPKVITPKNQIRSIQRFLRKKDLPPEVKETQERKLEELKKQHDLHNRLAVERKRFSRDKKIKFFEERKIARGIRRLEKLQRSSSDKEDETKIPDEVFKLKEDLEYVKFFPKKEKYVPLYCGGDDEKLVEKRNKLRMQIKANILAAAANGKVSEETGSEDDGVVDLSDDDFFVSGNSSDEANADNELTDLSAREQGSSASGKTLSDLSQDERKQQKVSAGSLMPPPRPMKPSTSKANTRTPSNRPSISRANTRAPSNKPSTGRANTWAPNNKPSTSRANTWAPSNKPSSSRANTWAPSNTSNNQSISYSSDRGLSNSQTGQSSNISSNSEPSKKRRKRRPKKK